ncbi:sensor histidine kinase [Streptomonospora nanhaiensis]|uniref:sensor histidine kinase n=3 Tax=Streptomonospora nanhaiensis TaxID=1323731 RepID=UPI00361CAC7B
MIRLLRRRRADSAEPAAPPAAAGTPPAADAAPAAPASSPRHAAPAPAPAAEQGPAGQPPAARTTPAEPAAPASADPAGGPMASVCDRFAMQVLVLAEQQRQALDLLERDEEDPERLGRLYAVDHAVAMMRRAARELRVLAGQDDSELGGDLASLLDVVRMAASSIESYTRIQIGTVAELAVPAYATDDVAALIAPLLDNATRYSPGSVAVSAHPTETGGVVVRIVDSGIGLKEEQVRTLNAAMAGPVPPVDDRTARHTGFPVVHRLAQRHGVGVHFSSRTAGGPGGTTVVVSLPPHLVCDIPAPPPPVGDLFAAGAPADPAGPAGAEQPAPAPPRLSLAPGPIGPESAPPPEPPPPERPPAGDLPRRERRSLRRQDAGGADRPRRPLAREGGTDADEAGTGPAPAGSFADDLAAFTSGAAGTGADDPPPPAGGPGTDRDDDNEVW